MRETLQLEDYEEEGFISANAFKEAFTALSIDGIDSDMLDFLIYLVYTKSGSVSSEQLKYWVLFDFLADKGQVNAGLLGTSTESRKRPESSSPEKLKARNKEKFKDIQALDKKKYSDHDEEEEE